MTESDLIARVLGGDPAAERQLYETHVNQVWRMTYRFAGDADRAMEWTQDTFVRVFSRLGDFRGESRLSTWIGSIAISVAMGGLRQRKRREQREVALDDAAPLASRDRADHGELRGRVAQAVDALAEGYRAVFLLHDLEGYTHEEIGQMLGIAPGTSKAQLHRARSRLRESLGTTQPAEG